MKELPEELYHYTLTKNVEGILREGLVPGKGESEYSPLINDPETVWLDSYYYSPPSRNCCIIAVETEKLDPIKLEQVSFNEEWYRYKGIIPPGMVEVVERGN